MSNKVSYSTLGIVVNDMVIRYGESLWPETIPRPGKDGSFGDQSRLTLLGGDFAKLFPFAALS